ncbi:TRM11 family SAM-dependent methyltransferase [Paenibacillus pini]|uniref:RNA methylase n=1 Tax=Paenibacillus pini JCM 16418 TaxID=1236976 RepID=W7Z0B6_9BACL|nr:RsmD family RNA methyltransferase [Paenibacillus pini]GAF08049.1 RNA methylase [Paenibacillus pini JCM 16418]
MTWINDIGRNQTNHIYVYSFHETERDLCRMEMRSLFGQAPSSEHLIYSDRQVDPDRSPFLSLRMDVIYSGSTVDEIAKQAASQQLPEEATFKVMYVKAGDSYSYDEQRGLERLIGSRIQGKAEMKQPDVTLGLLAVDGRWMFGSCEFPKRDWLKHKHKPQNYSTGLSITVARSLLNIAVPDARNCKVIDPCCGMGNVLIEGLSMGMDIVGGDLNPLAVKGARVNLKHFGYPEVVSLKDMNEIEGRYDAAILDMPYNLCSVISGEDQHEMLSSLRRMTKRAMVVSTQDIHNTLVEAGFTIVDEGKLAKGNFVRNLWLCI